MKQILGFLVAAVLCLPFSTRAAYYVTTDNGSEFSGTFEVETGATTIVSSARNLLPGGSSVGALWISRTWGCVMYCGTGAQIAGSTGTIDNFYDAFFSGDDPSRTDVKVGNGLKMFDDSNGYYENLVINQTVWFRFSGITDTGGYDFGRYSGSFCFSTNRWTCGVPEPPPVPEPGTLALLGLGLAGIGLSRRRKAV